MSEGLATVLRSHYEGFLDRPFLRVPGGRTLSYGQVDEQAARFGAALGEAGVEPGDRVVVQLEKGPGAVALYLACLRVGAVHVPLNPAYTAPELDYFVSDSEPRVIVCEPSRFGAIEAIARSRGVQSLLTLGSDRAEDLVLRSEGLEGIDLLSSRGDMPAVMLYTSGTTGRPKGAVLTHSNLVSNAMALRSAWGFRSGDVLLHMLPIFHAHGLFVALHTAVLNASEVIFLPRFDPDGVLDQLPEATVVMGVPTHYVRLLASPRLDVERCRGVRLFTSGSAPLPPAVFEAFEDRTGHRLLERYGTTETGMITSNPLEGERVAGSVGYPLPGVTVRVVDDEGRDCRPGEVGSVCVAGPGVFAGYWRRLDEPGGDGGSRLDDGLFVTGDLGRLAEDERLCLEGRSSEVVITAGINVYPLEIERRLEEVAEVAECAVVGLPHPVLGEAVVAFVAPAGDVQGGEPVEKALRDHVEANLARFKWPRRYYVVERLPRNAMGKVTKAALRTEHADAFTGPA